MIFKRFSTLALSLMIGAASVHAEPLADTASTPPAAGPGTAPAGTPASTAGGTPAAVAPANAISASGKEPMIEVSVDTLEISENNEEALGLTWNTPISFQEKSIPSIFNVGTFTRVAQLEATLNAMITNNQARVLANPTLLTKSSFEATFAVGGEIPYPTVGQGGVQGVEYKKYGVILKILPVITPRKTIEAQINVTVSNPDTTNEITLDNIKVPGIASRDAGSKVEVLDGETVVLAGIKQSTRSKSLTKVPFLGSIPVLGLLFRSHDDIVTQNSLVIFVTFRLIK